MKNSKKFLDIYNELNELFRDILKTDDNMSFYYLIENVSKTNAVVRRYKKQLKKYGDLRNAIVHSNSGELVIAEPNDFAVNELEGVLKSIKNPKLIYDICKHDVKHLEVNDSFDSALVLMKEYDFSQVPIYDDNVFCGMLNAEIIASWLRNNIDEDVVSISETSVKNLMKYDDADSHETIFRPRDTTVIELIEEYKRFSESQKKIDAVIITHSGNQTQEPLTIITDYDIPYLLEYL